MRVVPFEPAHLEQLKLQKGQEYLTPYLGQAEITGEAFTGFSESGRMLGCAGFVPTDLVPSTHPKALAWAMLCEMTRGEFVAVHRTVRDMLERQPYRRITATVDCAFLEGHRWVRQLGFHLEAPRMIFGGLNGRDCSLYARIR